MSENINNTINNENNISELTQPLAASGLGNLAIDVKKYDENTDSSVVEHQQAIENRVNSIVKSLKQEVYGSDNPDSQVISQILNYLSNAIVEMRTIDPKSEKATFYETQLVLLRDSLRIANINSVFNRDDFIPPLTRLEQETQ